MELNSNSTIPLFTQLKEIIKDLIIEGAYVGGDKIPTEKELSIRYGVSRITVRRAVEELVKEGFLVKIQGNGTFVRENKITRKIEPTLSFSEACLLNNLAPSSKIIKKEIIVPDEQLKADMGFFPGQRVLFIQRIRYAGNVPVMCENNFYPYEGYKFLMEEELDGSLYHLLETKYHIKLGKTKNSYIDALRANQENSKLLNVPVGEPLFFLHTMAFDTRERLIHVGHQYIVGSRYRFYYSNS